MQAREDRLLSSVFQGDPWAAVVSYYPAEGALKAGRFDDLFAWSLRTAASWWVGDVLDPLTAAGDQARTHTAPEAANDDIEAVGLEDLAA